jgi:hypothetical protein
VVPRRALWSAYGSRAGTQLGPGWRTPTGRSVSVAIRAVRQQQYEGGKEKSGIRREREEKGGRGEGG